MNLFQLEYFVVVAEELHFARAADRLHIAQPSLSFQIKQLEEELGVRLLERTTRRVELTEAGNVFLGKTQQCLRMLQEGMEAARRVERGEEGTLLLGYNGYALYNVMPALLQAFRSRHPHAQMKVREVYAPEMEEQLQHEELDAALAVTHGVSAGELNTEMQLRDSVWLPMFQEPMYVAMPKTNALSQEREIRLSMLAKEEFIVMDRVQKPTAYAQTILFCQQGGFFPTIAQEALSVEAIIGLVAAGAGVAFATASMRELRADKVAYLRLTAPEVMVGYGLIWRQGNESPLVRSLLEIARDLSVTWV
jgi:DNA-binding transcriptional LysR family regulator